MSKPPDALRRISLFALVFILFISAISLCFAATNEGYGEDQTSLGQVVDSFETSDNISVTVDVIRNSTLEAMELNTTAGDIKIYEDFTAYTQVEPDNRVDVINETYVAHQAERDEDSYLYFDYGTDYFDNFTHQFIWESDFAELTGIGYVWMVSDIADDAKGIDDAGGNFLGLQTYRDGSGRRLVLRECDSGTLYTTIWQSGPLANTLYYTNVSKYGLDLTVKIYDDPGMTNLIRTMSLTLQTDHKLEYIIPVNTWNSGLDVFSNSDVYFLWIGKTNAGFTNSGYFSTVDYLDNPLVSGAGLAVLVNTTIPANTDIQFQVSSDNVTWTDHEGTPGNSEDLLGGFEAIDLRDLNYSENIYFRGNLSTTDSSISPLFNQIRLITMIGNQTIQIQNVTGEWIYYNLTAIANITGVHDEGFLNSTYVIDGNTWNCSEVVGAPGYIVNFNVTGIDTDAISLWLVNYVYYDGVLNHHIHVEAWNFTAPGWVEIGLIDDDVGFEWHNYTVYEMRVPNDFVNSTGVFVGRFNHVTAGNINDDIVFDRISLLAFVPSAAAGAVEPFQFFWIVIAIALMLIGIVLAKMWPEEGDP